MLNALVNINLQTMIRSCFSKHFLSFSRYCRIEEVDTHVMYHYCDALPGSSGSGVYLWNYDADDQTWERKLIGVFSGNRWRYYKDWWRSPANFNAAIRLNSAKYTQICQWMGSYAKKQCKQKYYKP